MSVLVALTVGLIIWIVAWAFGIKSSDAFLVVILLVMGAISARVVSPFVRRQLGGG